MNLVDHESRKTDGDVFGSFGRRRAVTDALAGLGNNRLAARDINRTLTVLDPYQAAEDYSDFAELGCLRGLLPALGTSHVGHADVSG